MIYVLAIYKLRSKGYIYYKQSHDPFLKGSRDCRGVMGNILNNVGYVKRKMSAFYISVRLVLCYIRLVSYYDWVSYYYAMWFLIRDVTSFLSLSQMTFLVWLLFSVSY